MVPDRHVADPAKCRRLTKSHKRRVEIAKRYNINQSTISRRVAKLYSDSKIEYGQVMASDPAIAALADPVKISEAAKQVWDVKSGHEENFAKLLIVFHTATRPGDRIRAVTEMRRHIDIGMHIADLTFNTERADRFISTVIATIRKHDPGIADVIARELSTQSADSASMARALVAPMVNEETAMIAHKSSMPPV